MASLLCTPPWKKKWGPDDLHFNVSNVNTTPTTEAILSQSYYCGSNRAVVVLETSNRGSQSKRLLMYPLKTRQSNGFEKFKLANINSEFVSLYFLAVLLFKNQFFSKGRVQKKSLFLGLIFPTSKSRGSPLLWRGGWFQSGESHRAFFWFLQKS